MASTRARIGEAREDLRPDDEQRGLRDHGLRGVRQRGGVTELGERPCGLCANPPRRRAQRRAQQRQRPRVAEVAEQPEERWGHRPPIDARVAAGGHLAEHRLEARRWVGKQRLTRGRRRSSSFADRLTQRGERARSLPLLASASAAVAREGSDAERAPSRRAPPACRTSRASALRTSSSSTRVARARTAARRASLRRTPGSRASTTTASASFVPISDRRSIARRRSAGSSSVSPADAAATPNRPRIPPCVRGPPAATCA